MTGNDAYAEATRKAKYGHRDWLVWQNRDGSWSARRASADAIKAALLAVGTAGRFTLVSASTAIRNKYNWRMGITFWRNARRGWL